MHDCPRSIDSPDRLRRLVVAPHADDEVLGCGGLLAKYPQHSAVAVAAKVDHVRSREFQTAKARLGYSHAFFLELPDGSVGHNMRRLVSLLDEIVNAFRPDEIYLPAPSMHQDHVATYEAGMRASRLSMTQSHWYPPTVLVYDVAAYDTNLYPNDLRWNVFESLTEAHVDAKIAAIRAYTSQLVEGPHPVNGIKQSAHALGSARQIPWAEQYALVRSVRGKAPLEVADSRPGAHAVAPLEPAHVLAVGTPTPENALATTTGLGAASEAVS